MVNIVLPHIQTGLHFSATSLSWVIYSAVMTGGSSLGLVLDVKDSPVNPSALWPPAPPAR